MGPHVHCAPTRGCLDLLSLFLADLCPFPRLQRMAKTSEKPRLRQIPSSEDMEAEGTETGAEGGDQARARVEPARPGSSGKEPERTQKLLQPQEELVLQQVGEGWRGWGGAGVGFADFWLFFIALTVLFQDPELPCPSPCGFLASKCFTFPVSYTQQSQVTVGLCLCSPAAPLPATLPFSRPDLWFAVRLLLVLQATPCG